MSIDKFMEHILVIQNNNLLSRFKNKSIIVEVDDFENLEQIKNDVQINNNLHCIVVHSTHDIASIEFNEEWKDIPIVVYATELGKVRDLISKLPLIQKLNIKFFLHPEFEQNYSAIQILSSLGVSSGIVINENADWEKLKKMMYYSLFGKVSHAPIEPFQYVHDLYDVFELYMRDAVIDYDSVYFNNPSKYLYVNGDGKIAFTKKDLEAQSFFLNDIDEMVDKESNVLYNQKIKSWQSILSEPTKCGECTAWRICMGKFLSSKDKLCQSFTQEWIEAVDASKRK